MFDESIDCLSLDATGRIALDELAACCGLRVDELEELIDYKALNPLEEAEPERVFSARWVMPLRTVARWRIDFDLDLFTAALLLGQLDRIAELEREVQSLRALLPTHPIRHAA